MVYLSTSLSIQSYKESIHSHSNHSNDQEITIHNANQANCAKKSFFYAQVGEGFKEPDISTFLLISSEELSLCTQFVHFKIRSNYKNTNYNESRFTLFI